jgi:hypothetical protein
VKIPEDRLSDKDRQTRDRLAHLPLITIVHLIYQQRAYEGDSKDYDFSGTSMREHWQSGLDGANLEAQGMAGNARRWQGHCGARCAP